MVAIERLYNSIVSHKILKETHKDLLVRALGVIEPSHEKTNKLNVVLARSDTNRPAQAQKRARGWKF